MTDMTPDEVAEIVAELMPIGGESRQAQALTLYVRAIEQNKLRVIELAYGLLWGTSMEDLRTPNGLAYSLARKALLEQLDRDGQARGITAARQLLESRKNSRTGNDDYTNPFGYQRKSSRD